MEGTVRCGSQGFFGKTGVRQDRCTSSQSVARQVLGETGVSQLGSTLMLEHIDLPAMELCKTSTNPSALPRDVLSTAPRVRDTPDRLCPAQTNLRLPRPGPRHTVTQARRLSAVCTAPACRDSLALVTRNTYTEPHLNSTSCATARPERLLGLSQVHPVCMHGLFVAPAARARPGGSLAGPTLRPPRYSCRVHSVMAHGEKPVDHCRPPGQCQPRALPSREIAPSVATYGVNPCYVLGRYSWQVFRVSAKSARGAHMTATPAYLAAHLRIVLSHLRRGSRCGTHSGTLTHIPQAVEGRTVVPWIEMPHLDHDVSSSTPHPGFIRQSIGRPIEPWLCDVSFGALGSSFRRVNHRTRPGCYRAALCPLAGNIIYNHSLGSHSVIRYHDAVVKYNRNNEPSYTGVGTPKAVFEKCDGFFNTREWSWPRTGSIFQMGTHRMLCAVLLDAISPPYICLIMEKVSPGARQVHEVTRTDHNSRLLTKLPKNRGFRSSNINFKGATSPRCPRETQTGREKPAIGKPPTLVFINIARARGRANYTPVNRATAHGKHDWQRCCPATWTPRFARQTPGQAALLSRHLDSGAVKSTGNGCLLYWGSWTVVKGYDSLSRRHTVDDIRPNVFITVPKGRRNFRIVRESRTFFA
ncbi:hypothetical protein Bbelb_443680 [Branchiostoma belcheri]|nr:hypothetical protein Bbelb_443680 [Branchiostoma belcheri]